MDPFDENHRVLSFPIWGLFKASSGQVKQGDPQLAVRLPNGERATVLFTEELFAERYRNSDSELKGLVAQAVSDANGFAEIVANAERYGINYATIDPPNTAAAQATAFPLMALRCVRRQAGDW
jgi:hypothetical protein